MASATTAHLLAGLPVRDEVVEIDRFTGSAENTAAEKKGAPRRPL